MTTWQTELAKELKSILRGQLEAGIVVDDLDQLIYALETTDMNDTFVANRLRELQLGYWAAHLETGAFHNRAELENKGESDE